MSMKIIEENEFSDCVNLISVKCHFKYLDYFNKTILTSIIFIDIGICIYSKQYIFLKVPVVISFNPSGIITALILDLLIKFKKIGSKLTTLKI